MAAPIQGATGAQQAQQASQKEAQTAKVQDSKFDGVMAQKANQASAVGQVQQAAQAQKAQQVSQAQKVTETAKADRARMNKSNAVTSNAVDGTSKTMEGGLMKFVGGLEQHQNKMNSILADAIGGKGQKMNFQQRTMLQMQVYQYSQEMDLTSKVVEKATSGLKDTLKTQV
jgi:hypothetical protein